MAALLGGIAQEGRRKPEVLVAGVAEARVEFQSLSFPLPAEPVCAALDCLPIAALRAPPPPADRLSSIGQTVFVRHRRTFEPFGKSF